MENVISVLGKAGKDYIRTEPFPHLVVRDALPQDLFQELIGSFPNTEEIVGSRALASNKLIIMGARQVAGNMTISDTWQKYFDYHTSHAFYLDVIALWQDFIAEAYPDIESVLGKALVDATTDTRHPGEGENTSNQAQDIQLDCQFVMEDRFINTGLTLKHPAETVEDACIVRMTFEYLLVVVKRLVKMFQFKQCISQINTALIKIR